MGNTATTPTEGCCFFTFSDTPGVYQPQPRFESILHGVLGGWVSCVNLTEFAGRTELLYGRRAGLWDRLKERSVADVSLCFSMIPAMINGTFFLVAMLSSSESWAQQELWYVTTGKMNWGYVLIPCASAFTSVQAVKISRLYAVLKDAARLRLYTKMKRLERLAYTWAFVSPLAYLAVFFFLISPSLDQLPYFTFACLVAGETMVGLGLCLFVLPLIERARVNNGKVWWLWCTCAGAALVGLLQIGLNAYQTYWAPAPLPAYCWDLLELAKAYYMFNLLVPTTHLHAESPAAAAAVAGELAG